MLVFLGLALGAGVELGIMLGPGRHYIAKRARKENLESINSGEWDEGFQALIKPILQPIQDDVSTLKDLGEAEDLKAHIEPVQAKLEELDQALGAHLTNLQEGMKDLPGRVRSSLEGVRGAEIKAIQKVAEDAEQEAISYYESEMPQEDRLAAKIDAMDPGPKWREKHEVGAMILDGVKEMIKLRVQETRGNVLSMRQTGAKGRFPNVYGP